MDSELDQVLCAALSLEEDYPSLSSPLRNKKNLTSLNEETSTDLQSSFIIHNNLLAIYNLLKFQQELEVKGPLSTMGAACRNVAALKPQKRKLYEENEQCKQPRIQTDPNLTRCRKRTNYTKEQTELLLNEFHRNPYPDFISRCHVSRITGISEPKIQVWFQNRRARYLSKPMKVQNFQTGEFSATSALPWASQKLGFHEGLQLPEEMWTFPNSVPLLC
ncbi:homeobox protein siamois-like [Gastrophryne carolinensis]